MPADSINFWVYLIIGAILISACLLRIKFGENPIFHYLGLEFVLRKFWPAKKETLPAGVIWAIGIYVALFGIASQRYENSVDLLETRYMAFVTVHSGNIPFDGRELMKLENTLCPSKPELLHPFSVFESILGLNQKPYPEFKRQGGLLFRYVEKWKYKLEKAIFSGTDLRWITLRDANLREALFDDANLSNSDFLNSNLSGSNMNKADLSSADLRWTLLNNSDLSDALLNGTDLSLTSLRGADFRRSKLKEAYLSGVDLSDVDLRWAQLIDADLVNANFTGANLKGSNLKGADLTEADFSKADLSEAKYISFDQLIKAKRLWKTVGINEKIKLRLLKEKPGLFKGPES